MNIPSNLEHVSEETRNDIYVLCFLLKIRHKLQVRTVFCLVGCSCERHINMFTGDPLVKVIFDLKEVLVVVVYSNNRKQTYHRLYEGNSSHRKCVVLRKLGVYNTIIIFILEPNFIDNGLYQRGAKYACFRFRILDVKCQQQFNSAVLLVTTNHLVDEAGSLQ